MHKIFFKIRAIDFKIRFNSLQLIGFPIQYGNVMTYHHIVVDDNSTDGCADIAAVLIRKQAYKTPCDYAGRQSDYHYSDYHYRYIRKSDSCGIRSGNILYGA